MWHTGMLVGDSEGARARGRKAGWARMCARTGRFRGADEWTDGQMHKWTDGQMHKWMDGQMYRWMEGRMDGLTDGRMDRIATAGTGRDETASDPNPPWRRSGGAAAVLRQTRAAVAGTPSRGETLFAPHCLRAAAAQHAGCSSRAQKNSCTYTAPMRHNESLTGGLPRASAACGGG